MDSTHTMPVGQELVSLVSYTDHLTVTQYNLVGTAQVAFSASVKTVMNEWRDGGKKWCNYVNPCSVREGEKHNMMSVLSPFNIEMKNRK